MRNPRTTTRHRSRAAIGVLAAGADDPGFNFVSTNAFRSEAG